MHCSASFQKPDQDPHPGFTSKSKAWSGTHKSDKSDPDPHYNEYLNSFRGSSAMTFTCYFYLDITFPAKLNHPLTLWCVKEPRLLGRGFLDRTQPGFSHSLRLARRFVGKSVVNPWHFGTDPDPRIPVSDQWILLFSSMTYKMATKTFFL